MHGNTDTLVAIDETMCWGYEGTPCKHIGTFRRPDGSLYMDMATRRTFYDIVTEQMEAGNFTLAGFVGLTCDRHQVMNTGPPVPMVTGDGGSYDSDDDDDVPPHNLFGDSTLDVGD
jgi:hypothetical protein